MSEHEPAGGAHTPPPGTRTMNVVRWALFAGLLALALASTVSYVLWRRGESTSHLAAARYHCPMHPTYTSDRPGECPICGMDLEPIPAGSEVAAPPDSQGVPGLTAVTLDPERVQMIGVRMARAQQRAIGQRLELVGFVTPDEGLLRQVQIRVSGWVAELHVRQTGVRVRDGEPLLTIDSPELLQTEQEFLIETSGHVEGSRDTSGHGHESGGPSAARRRLWQLGVPEAEIQRLQRERLPRQRLTLVSPVIGTVLERNVTQGQYVGPGATLFTVANLSRVWVMADLYEMDLGRIRIGDPATFTSEGLPGRTFRSRVEFVYPTVSPETRTVKVRLLLPNAEGLLRPGMYGRVVVNGRASQAVAVPVESVVRTGDETYVFMARAGGRFEPRRVVTGAQDGEWTQILSGIAAGDTVVASASFLIDSESRLKAAIGGLGGAAQPAPKH